MISIRLEDLFSSLRKWVASTDADIESIVLIGSQSHKTETDELNRRSDVDLMVFVGDQCEEELVYSELATIGNDLGILLHPLIIRQEDKMMKLDIPQYRDAFQRGKVVYQHAKR